MTVLFGVGTLKKITSQYAGSIEEYTYNKKKTGTHEQKEVTDTSER